MKDYEIGDRVYVRWYGGTDMPCVVASEDTVEKEIAPGEGTGNPIRVGERDIVEDPKPWSITAWRLVEEEKRQ